MFYVPNLDFFFLINLFYMVYNLFMKYLKVHNTQVKKKFLGRGHIKQ